jgi:hypothetical protein
MTVFDAAIFVLWRDGGEENRACAARCRGRILGCSNDIPFRILTEYPVPLFVVTFVAKYIVDGQTGRKT